MEENAFICKFCSKICKNKNSLAQHICRCKCNPNAVIKKAWNAGLTKEIDPRVKAQSESLTKSSRWDDHYKAYLQNNSIAYGQQNMQHYKKYFLEEQQHKCAICGCLDEWCGKKLVFILDHIDGNADNNNRDNLRLVCPNCDSQLDTFKSKNKNSARAKHRNIKVLTEEEYNNLVESDK